MSLTHEFRTPAGGRREDLPSLENVRPLPRATRDVALDLVRGLAIVILMVNHLHFESPLETATSALLSAAEMLVAISGVVVGMVFGRRWLTLGARATTGMLLRRARKLYVASVVVVALVGLLKLVPGLATDALTVSRGADHYVHDGVLRTMLAVVTLEAGPWQFNILSFFVVVLAAAPAVLWLLARGRWPLVLAGSWVAYLAARTWSLDVLPSQSERPFPLLIWQLLFVHGVVLGWHRERISAALGRGRVVVEGAVLAVGALSAYVLLAGPGTDQAWLDRHFDKDTLDLARIVAMTSMTAAVYFLLRRHERRAAALLGPLLLPLGRASFYVFTMQVFVCLAVASIPFLAGDGLGPAGNVAVQLGCIALMWTMVTRRFLFRWVPR